MQRERFTEIDLKFALHFTDWIMKLFVCVFRGFDKMSFHSLYTVMMVTFSPIRRNRRKKPSHGRSRLAEHWHGFISFLFFSVTRISCEFCNWKTVTSQKWMLYIRLFDGFLGGVPPIVMKQFVEIYSKHNGNFRIIIRTVPMSVFTCSSGLLFLLSSTFHIRRTFISHKNVQRSNEANRR